MAPNKPTGPRPRCECGETGHTVYRREGKQSVMRPIEGWAWCLTHGMFIVGRAGRTATTKA